MSKIEKIPPFRIRKGSMDADAMHGWLEGTVGDWCRYWCSPVSISQLRGLFDGVTESVKVTVHDELKDDGDPDDFFVTIESIRSGIREMDKKDSHHVDALLNDGICDDITMDVVWQYAVLGECRYG